MRATRSRGCDHDSYHCACERRRGNAAPVVPRCRQGESPCARRPLRRAAGWRRWRNAVTDRSPSRRRRVGPGRPRSARSPPRAASIKRAAAARQEEGHNPEEHVPDDSEQRQAGQRREHEVPLRSVHESGEWAVLDPLLRLERACAPGAVVDATQVETLPRWRGRRGGRSRSDARDGCSARATFARATPPRGRSPAAAASSREPSFADDARRPPRRGSRASRHAPGDASRCRRRRRPRRNCGSKPSIASRASRLKAMLQPGMCSASVSEMSTWIGPPGAFATQAAIAPSSAGGRFGPPTAACSGRAECLDEEAKPIRIWAGVIVQIGDDLAASSREPGVARGTESLVFGADQRTSNSDAIAAVSSVEPSSTTIVS